MGLKAIRTGRQQTCTPPTPDSRTQKRKANKANHHPYK
jgi:hypothetical protein